MAPEQSQSGSDMRPVHSQELNLNIKDVLVASIGQSVLPRVVLCREVMCMSLCNVYMYVHVCTTHTATLLCLC